MKKDYNESMGFALTQEEIEDAIIRNEKIAKEGTFEIKDSIDSTEISISSTSSGGFVGSSKSVSDDMNYKEKYENLLKSFQDLLEYLK